MVKHLVVAIDGPAGSGKSTVGKLLAKRLKCMCLDSGAIYRAVALSCMRKNINFNSQQEIVNVITNSDIHISSDKIFLTGEDVSEEIRKPEVTAKTFYVARSALAREKIVELERKIVGTEAAVVEGRDTGTVVFPNAPVKIYLDANLGERAIRRCEELRKKGLSVPLEDVKAEIAKRDNSDTNRDIGPLSRAKDALVVDTSNLTIEQVVDALEKIVNS